MKAQFVVVSAYMAIALLTVAMVIIYVDILPHTQTYLSTHNSLSRIKEIVYSRPKWNAETLAREIYSQLSLKYVYVNITAYNITSGKLINEDYYVIRPLSYKVIMYISYNFTTLDPTGIIYIYNIKVGT